MRSKLFVPGSRPELFAKALAGEADAISIDLEDSVLNSRKDEARANVTEFLLSADVLASDKLIIVRCNALGTPHFEADVLAVALPGLGILNLPKVESAADVSDAARVLQQVETDNGIANPVDLLVTIETPGGMRRAASIAAAHPRVVGLQLGLNDLFESLGIDRRDTSNVHAAMFALRMAAGEAGVFAFDGAFPDIPDGRGLGEEAEMAHLLGYYGKSCIHPSQVAPVNQVFMRSNDVMTAAKRVVEASRQAESKGIGAFTVDGKMIDRPSIRRAELIVATGKTSK